MDLRGKDVLVAGAGISGVGAAELLVELGAQVILFDENRKLSEEKIRERFERPLPDVKIVLGELPEECKKSLVLAILSPAVPLDSPFVQDLKAHGIKISGEIELASRYMKGTLAAVTGTNGKTTTVALAGEILKAWYEHVFVVGNIGDSFARHALETTEDSQIVAEISSFQLETVETFHPHISVIMNVTPDHLNRHHSMECYINTKERIFMNQTADDFTILNYDDPVTREMSSKTKAKVIWFSSTQELSDGYYFKDHAILYAQDGKTQHICYDHDLNILGLHNMENAMAAVAIARCLSVPMDTIFTALTQFKAVEHRIEYVTEKKGVVYYNDSKGTNTDAAIKAVQAMTRPTILIGGGYDKQSPYDDWIESFDGKVRLLVLLGQTADKIEACARKHGFQNIIRVESLKEAVEVCAAQAQPGDAVLLSPACASWGMFQNFEERGRLFKQYVNELED